MSPDGDPARLVDVGAGTGRGFASSEGWWSTSTSSRAAPMLRVAARRLTAHGGVDFTISEADVRALPLADASVDLAVAGGVFWHFRHWMPDGWRDEVDAAERAHGFQRSWIRTDYAFPDPEAAAEVCGRFFGDAFAARVREERWARVPECTAIFVARR